MEKTILEPTAQRRAWRMSERVANDLRKMILAGELSAERRLPPGPEFAQRLGVSQHHLREALRLLEQDGLVRVIPGRNGGIFIAPPDEAAFTRSFGVILAHNGTLLKDLMAARAVIEPAIAGMAAVSATEEDLAALQANIDEQDSVGSYRKGLNAEFHLGVTAAAHNQTFLVIMQAMEKLVHTIDLAVGRKELREDSLRAHRAILRALRARDAEKASSVVRAHVLGYQERMVQAGVDMDTYTVQDLIEAASRPALHQEPAS